MKVFQLASSAPAGQSGSRTRVLVVAVIVILIVAAGLAYALSRGTSSSPPSSSTGGSTTSASEGSFPFGGGAFNTPGNILITDQFNNRVIELNPQTNQIVWSFGSGNGSLCNPGPGSTIGPNDAERLAGGLTLIAGTGIPSGLSPPAPPACADNRVIIVNQAGSIVWQYGQAGVNGSGAGLLSVPVFAIQTPNKDIMIVDQANNRVIEVNYTTKAIDWSYPSASGVGSLNNPNAAQVLANGNVLIANQNNNSVIEVNPTTDKIVWSYSTGLETAADATRLPNGDTLIADAGHSRIVEVSAQGSVVWQYFTNKSQGSNATPYPSNAVRLADGDTSIADTLNERCIVVNNAGQIVYQYGMTNVPGAGANQLNWPYSCYVVGDYTGQTPPPNPSGIGSVAAMAQVTIPNGTGATQSLSFDPKTITVVIGVNNTVEWTNDDTVVHTVTSVSVPTGAQSFNEGSLSPGATFSVTLTMPGTYTYHCSIHSWMTGTIIVKSG